MGKSLVIKNAVLQVLGGIQYKGENAFVAVTDNTAEDFAGSPVLRLLPNMIENVKGSMSQNDRTVNYQAVVHLSLEDSTAIQAVTIDQMYDLTDLILDALDEGDFSNKLTDIDPTIGEYIMEAGPANWDVVDSKGGALLMLVIDIKVGYLKDLENGID